MKRCCTKCGKELILRNKEIVDGMFDPETGNKLGVKLKSYWVCPDFISGYSDRYYQYHDLVILSVDSDGNEEVQTVSGH